MKGKLLNEDLHLHNDKIKMRAVKLVSALAGTESITSDMQVKILMATKGKNMARPKRGHIKARIFETFTVALSNVNISAGNIERPTPTPTDEERAAPTPTDEERPAPTPAYVHRYPFNYFPTHYPANGVMGRILLNRFLHVFSPWLSHTTANTNLQNQAPLSLHHRHATSFPKSIAKINQSKRGYFLEILKTLAVTLGTQLFRSGVIQGAIKPSPSPQPASASRQQYNLDGADSTCSVPRTKAMLNEEKGVDYTRQHIPQTASMDLSSLF